MYDPRPQAEPQPLSLPPLPGLMHVNGFPVAGLSDNELKGGVTVLNVFATWCPPCRGEHPTLLQLSRERRVRLVGLLSRDKAQNGVAFLKENGNPFQAVSVDSGRLARRYRVRAYPTTLVLDRRGEVVARIVGPLDAERVKSELMPAVYRAREI